MAQVIFQGQFARQPVRLPVFFRSPSKIQIGQKLHAYLFLDEARVSCFVPKIENNNNKKDQQTNALESIQTKGYHFQYINSRR